MKRIELHIEELVLHGFAPADRYRIGDTVQRELTRLLAEQGMPASLIQVARWRDSMGEHLR